MSDISQLQPIDLTVENKEMDDLNNNASEPKIVGIKGVSEEDIQEYKNNYKAHEVGISHDEMVKVYSNWAKSYDQDLRSGRYNGPEIAAEEMSKFYSPEERPLVRILDVAAGTGRVGEQLAERGFKIMDALEPSKGMLDVLIARNIYGKTYESAVGYKPVVEIVADSYDALVIAGGMGEGHIPVRAIDEFLRIVRPGGLIFIVMREEYLETVEQYSGKLEPFMEAIVEKGLWMQIQRKVVRNYSFNKNGVVYVYQKTE